MNHCAIQQNAFAAVDEMRASFAAAADRRPPVFCPKPRRLGQVEPIHCLRWQPSYQSDLSDSSAGTELLQIFLTKGVGEMASSPPFFAGSPPSRAANPVVHDARFGEDRPVGPVPSPGPVAGQPRSPRAGCARAKFGLKPAAVRVEGFDCLDRDHRRGRHSVPAVA